MPLSSNISPLSDHRHSVNQCAGTESLLEIEGVSPKTQDNPMDPSSALLVPQMIQLDTAQENKLSFKRKALVNMREAFSERTLRRRIPILAWLPTYNKSCFIRDLIAGITVGLTIIPQSIAYAGVAGLPFEYGLYSSFMGFFTYVIFGSVKESSIGPTAILAIMTFSYANEGGPEYACLLAFLAGALELLAGIFHLGFMVEFISAPVISGFCSAAALTVASTQIKSLFGLKFKGSAFVDVWFGFFTHVAEVKRWDALLGCSSIVILLLMRKLTALKNFRPFRNIRCLRIGFIDKSLWFIATSRNAIAVISGCIAAFYLEQKGLMPFTLTGDIKSGLPPFALPEFSTNRTEGNSTVILSFTDICSELGAAIGLIPLIAVLEQVAIAKAFANGKHTDATQEMIALGVGNLLGSFFGSMPITASFGRSSVQSASGVKTPLSNFWGGLLVLLALAFLMPCLAYIPKPMLAAVIITSVIFMVEIEEIKPMWRSRRIELIPFTVTFFCCLFVNMEYGILIGAGLHLILLAYTSSRTKPNLIKFDGNEHTEKCMIVRADANLYFPGVESFRDALNQATETESFGSSPSLIIDLTHVSEIDYTALKMLHSVLAECKRRGCAVLYFTNASPRVIHSISSFLPSSDIVFSNKDRSLLGVNHDR